MPGIYIHIPFCRKACHYCDFHFSTLLKNKDAFFPALKKEITLRKDYLKNSGKEISSVYFGGGTPSLLSQKELHIIFDELQKFFTIEKNAEITLEANPDDLTKEKLTELKNTPVNRLSIGIQSFHDDDLKWMNRIHSGDQAKNSVKDALALGSKNITIDLIYGIPTLSNEKWKQNLETFFSLGIPHLSAYCLTVEPQTALANFIKKGKVKGVDDEIALRQFEILMDEMEKKNFIQYEISNFCKDGFHSYHNSSYWKNQPYLGLGPSAHSFDGNSRQWNISNNSLYIKSLEKGESCFEMEILSETDKYNEYILTSLRTIWGCDLKKVKKFFGENRLFELLESSKPFINDNSLIQKGDVLLLSKSGKFISDKIMRELFV